MSKESNQNNEEYCVEDSRTFLRWINFTLIPKSNSINDLQYDLCDGTVLIDLLECLTSKQQIPNSLKSNNNIRKQKLNRVTLVVDYMKGENVETCSDIGKSKIYLKLLILC